MSNGGSDESGEGLTLLARVEALEVRSELYAEGLTAVETILRTTFPQFFEAPQGANDNGDTETISGSGEGPGEAEKETGEEVPERENQTGEEKSPEETPEDTPQVVTE